MEISVRSNERDKYIHEPGADKQTQRGHAWLCRGSTRRVKPYRVIIATAGAVQIINRVQNKTIVLRGTIFNIVSSINYLSSDRDL